ncbi:hypothetical protein FNH22_31540 [Fulvivirga sp. M361]|uniref:RHS repeat domain-containing protein n=1 Tax=Fulvivirga sp. M361 TaxID=2594266 RepID=UPI00117B157B|nr:RHS repeat-associated core domain-containing protein [Fulvivirga sp. M361]TRX45317.1 hypothetical protein FNH22_31540 [Fulvivirga sp. M361]
MEHYGFEEANYKAERLAIEEMIVETEGHLHVFVSNEGENVRPVYFDDLKIEQRTVATPEQMAIRQQAMARSTSGCDGVNYLYNGIELNKETQVYETEFRGYDPALGRFMQIDPLAGTVPGVTGYNFGFNNPMKFKDPLGLMGDNSQDMFGRDRFDNFTGIYIPPFARGAHRDTSHEWAESLEANKNNDSKKNEKTYKLAPYGTETRRKNGELISLTVEGYYLVPVEDQQSGGINPANLASDLAGESIVHNLRRVWEIYNELGTSGTISGEQVIDPETMDWFAQHGSWGGLATQTKPCTIAGQKVHVNFIHQSGERKVFGASISRITTPGVQNGKYVGGNLGAQVRFGWGPVEFSINFSKSQLYNNGGADFRNALKYMNNLKGHIQGYNTGLPFQTSYPY